MTTTWPDDSSVDARREDPARVMQEHQNSSNTLTPEELDAPEKATLRSEAEHVIVDAATLDVSSANNIAYVLMSVTIFTWLVVTLSWLARLNITLWLELAVTLIMVVEVASVFKVRRSVPQHRLFWAVLMFVAFAALILAFALGAPK